jgi:GNAT superfamily N-acetyltransferase
MHLIAAYGEVVDLVDVAVEATFDLRLAVLGWTVARTGIDRDDASHLALVDRRAVVATVSHMAWTCPDAPDIPARYFWAMAVDATYQRCGYGRRLLEALAARARTAGEQLMWADARESAIDFYRACGAQVVGEPYRDDVTGLVDRRIILTLSPTPRSSPTHGPGPVM